MLRISCAGLRASEERFQDCVEGAMGERPLTMFEPAYSWRESCDCDTVLKKCAEGDEPGSPAYSCA